MRETFATEARRQVQPRSHRAPAVHRRPARFADPAFPFEVAHVDEPAVCGEAYHWHDFMELSVVTAGSGAYEIEDKRVRVRAGDIVVLNNVERHRLHSSPRSTMRETVFHFAPQFLDVAAAERSSGGFLRLFLYDGAAFDNRPRLPAPARREALALSESIVAEWRGREPHYQLAIHARLLTLVSLLLRHCTINPRPAQERALRREAIDRLDRILAYLRVHLDEPALSLQSVARRFDLNASYFSDYFKRSLGQGFHEFLTSARIQHAQALMRDKHLTVSRAAFESGFGSQSAFYGAFRRSTGRSPRQLRSQKS